jgi:hypothetical protein
MDVDVQPQPGLGLDVSLVVPLGQRSLTLNPWVGLAAIRFTGPFPADPAIPDSDGGIGVGFSPLKLGAAIEWHF